MSRSLLRLVPALLTAAVFAVGCAQTTTSTLDTAQATPDNFSRAKAAGIRPVAIGNFTSAQDKFPAEARYLRDTLDVELQGAGLVNPSSTAVIDGQLVVSDLGATAASVGARFTVTVSGRVVYDRELRTSSTWDKSANAGRQQGAVYNKLVGVLLADPGFKNAVPR